MLLTPTLSPLVPRGEREKISGGHSRGGICGTSAFRSNRLGLRCEMELFHFQGRRQRGASALRFRAADPLGCSNHLDVSGGEQFQNALVEAEVANRIPNLSLLDEPYTVPRQPGEQSCPRIDAANVPETAHQKTTVGGRKHLFHDNRPRGT